MAPSVQQQIIINSVLSTSFTAVSAGAGTGKTYTTVEVVVELLRQEKTTGDKFALITFTNKAATELRQRIQERLMELIQTTTNPSKRLWWLKQLELLQLSFVGTIHSFCRQILLKDGYRAGDNININHSPTMRMDAFELEQMAYEILDDCVTSEAFKVRDLLLSPDKLPWVDILDYQVVQSLVGALVILRGSGKSVVDFCETARRQDPERGLQDAFDPNLSVEDRQKQEQELKQRAKDNFDRRMFMIDLLLAVNKRYTQHKQQENMIDQEDLLLLTEKVLSMDSVLRDAVITQYPNLFVDEFQDTDNTQKMIIDALFSVGGQTYNEEGDVLHRILVVGDPKQSIYGFRGANVQLLQEFATQHGITLLALTESRRPTPELAAEFQRLFQSIDRRCFLGNATFSSDALDSARDMFDKPRIHQGAQNRPIYKQTLESDEHISQMINDINRLHNNGDGVPYEKMAVLVRSNRQVGQVMSHAFFEQNAQSDSQGTFWRKREILDTLNVLRWVEQGEIPTVVHIALRTFWFSMCVEEQQQLEAVQSIDVSRLPGNIHISEFIRKLRDISTHKSALHVLKELFECKTRQNNTEKIWDKLSLSQQQNLKHLYALANDIFMKGEALTLSEFMAWFEHKVMTEQEEQDASERYGLGVTKRIKVMTIHQAKGLEFPIVLMPFVERSLTGEQYHPTVLVDETIGIDFNFEKVRALDFTEHVDRLDRLRLEEELRILYVGVTRTEDQLYVYGQPRGLSNIGEPYWSWLDEFIAVGVG